MTKKWNLKTSNAETGLKIGIYAKNWAKQVLLKIFDYGQSQRSTVRVNGQRMTYANVAVWRHLGLRWQDTKHSRHVERVGECGTGTWGAWQILAARAGAWSACDAVSGRSWLGFARDWLFCLPMPFLWLFNEQKVDIQELQVLWAWRQWLTSDSDYWMNAKAAEERRRCPQEPESQRNGSDTMLTI